jgi:hypothetical protein
VRIVPLLIWGVVFAAHGISQSATPSVADRSGNSVAEVHLGQSAFPLNKPWKFTIGDSPIDAATGQPLWAEPGFDDSHWENLDLTPEAGSTEFTTGLGGYVTGWTAHGHPGYSGYAWYRIRVRVLGPAGQKLALAGPAVIDDAYQVFADGKLLGSFGKFSGKTPVSYNGQPMLFDAPPISDATQGAEVIAFRVWMAPETLIQQEDAGGIHTAPILGDAAVVGAGYTVTWLQLVEGDLLPESLMALAALLCTVVAITLWAFDRRDRVYLWMAGVYLLSTALYGFSVWDYCTQTVSFRADVLLNDCVIHALLSAGWVMVWWVWFGRPRPRWIPQAAAVLCVALMVSRAVGAQVLGVAIPHGLGAAAEVISLTIRLLYALLTLWIVIQGIRRQGLEGWLVLPAVVLRGIAAYSFELIEWHLLPARFIVFGYTLPIATPVSAMLFLALTVLLLRRLAASVGRQRQMALDIKQAQEVQQMIVPEARVEHPGLSIEPVFRPAREVGGDFFQILPHPTDGSLLIVAGDVAGKGLQAGMLVALLVGAIRTALETSYDPAFVISLLNRQLIGRAQGATTCLALRIAADGAVKLANAGHLPPYLNGKQLGMEGALPLGLFAGAEPSQMRFQLEPGDRLVLISDGILEAMNGQGELFGFERIAELLGGEASASALADAAQGFGQEDDISVIAVSRSLVELPATV